MNRRVELVCPAGGPAALRAAVDHGADAVYTGFRDGTNARNFPGLNFDTDELAQAVDYAHARNTKVLLALNIYPTPERWPAAVSALERAAELAVDAVILADPGLLHYATQQLPGLRLHLSVQGSATNRHAIDYYHELFGIRRVVLPRVLSLAQVSHLAEQSAVEIEVFGFGSLCVMVEGRCALSSFVTGESPNQHGICSPARAVRWEETPTGRQSRLNNVLIDHFSTGEAAGYPTLCKGRFLVGDRVFHAIEEPTGLNVLEILPELVNAGVAAIKVEGRQRSPAYVAQVTRTLRQALDTCLADPQRFRVREEWQECLQQLAEGHTQTLGAYSRPWQ
ncbi:MAG: peptidase U32 family protein [Gammaproteobacteria bacterium]|nr:peptidase U32 family protein [Gammaproteobacteria bacterium]